MANDDAILLDTGGDMTELQTFRQVFADKIAAGGNFDEAFGKAIWMAYNEGVLAGLSDTREDKSNTVTGVQEVLQQGYNRG